MSVSFLTIYDDFNNSCRRQVSQEANAKKPYLLSKQERGKEQDSHAHLTEIIRPRQEHYPRVILLPMRDDETEQDQPQDAVHREHGQAELAVAPVDREQGNGQEQGSPGV